MNGCAYGPPPDEAIYSEEPQIVETQEVKENNDKSSEKNLRNIEREKKDVKSRD